MRRATSPCNHGGPAARNKRVRWRMRAILSTGRTAALRSVGTMQGSILTSMSKLPTLSAPVSGDTGSVIPKPTLANGLGSVTARNSFAGVVSKTGVAGVMAKAALASGIRKAGFGGQCEICRQWCEAGALCAACIARFASPRPRCGRCGQRLGTAAAVCGDCAGEPPPFARTVCAVDYDFPWDRLLAAFKFRGHVELAGTLAMRMADAVTGAGSQLPDLVVPVPLSAARLRERGYNQAWELARRLARRLQLPADATLLQRPVDTAHQADLGRSERRQNLRTAFMVDPQRRQGLVGRHVALVDDVMTTGATAREAATVLLRAGAATVDAWVLARTPAPANGRNGASTSQ